MTGLPGRSSHYDTQPYVPVEGALVVGQQAIAQALSDTGARVIVVETYPGVRTSDLLAVLTLLAADLVVEVSAAYRTAVDLAELVHPDLTDDPLFGRFGNFAIADLFDRAALQDLRQLVRQQAGTVVVLGTGASLVAEPDLLVLADLPRREAQLRQRRGEVGNLGADNAGERASLLYKRALFLDWPAADRLKAGLLDRIDFWLDTTVGDRPGLASGQDVRRALAHVATRPFRLVPFFDPAPWGGQWLKQVCDLDPASTNVGWCFDCVPEENTLVLGFGAERLELPATNLVLCQPQALLGTHVRQRYGDEFPIRFDFLDTMGGGNLSLQVHPTTEQIRAEFGASYTQDESYYLLDAEPEARVYLGLQTGIDPEQMLADLQAAQNGGPAFVAERHVNVLPARRHDHFLIPAGTVHCSGAGALVLEISATPFIFTFKLWDWDRPGLDGQPRPINLERGSQAIAWDRDTAYVQRELVNTVTPLPGGLGWTAERTGLHPDQPLETHRHWFTAAVPHHTGGRVNVLNLVEGEQVTVRSPTAAFAPYEVHYAETFIVPAAVGAYVIEPSGPSGQRCGTLKAFVR